MPKNSKRYKAPVAIMDRSDSRHIQARATDNDENHTKNWWSVMLQGKKRPNLSWQILWEGIGADEDQSFQKKINQKAKSFMDFDENLSENCLFGTGMPQYWPQGGAVETIAPHLLGLAASISRRATSTY